MVSIPSHYLFSYLTTPTIPLHHQIHTLPRHLWCPYIASHSWYLTCTGSIQGLYKGVGLTTGLYKEDQWIRRLVQLDRRYASTET